jgi:hypothetical protein
MDTIAPRPEPIMLKYGFPLSRLHDIAALRAQEAPKMLEAYRRGLALGWSREDARWCARFITRGHLRHAPNAFRTPFKER